MKYSTVSIVVVYYGTEGKDRKSLRKWIGKWGLNKKQRGKPLRPPVRLSFSSEAHIVSCVCYHSAIEK